MVKKEWIFILLIVMIGSFVLAEIPTPTPPPIGDSSCVAGTPGCNKDTTSTPTPTPTLYDDYSEDYESDYVPFEEMTDEQIIEKIKDYKDEFLKAINSCTPKIKDCNVDCGSMADRPPEPKTDCYDNCWNTFIKYRDEYVGCVYDISVTGYNYLTPKVSMLASQQCNIDFNENDCYDSCKSVTEVNEIIECNHGCLLSLRKAQSKYDVCKMQMYNPAEAYYSKLISQIKSTHSASSQLQPEQPVTTSAELENKVFSIEESNGEVNILSKDGSYRPIATGTMIAAGDTIKTGSNGNIRVTTPDGNIVVVAPNSEFRLEELKKDTLTLNFGKIWTKFKNLGLKKFIVHTPTAAVSIRGTEFITEYDPNTQTTTISLYEGELEITDSNNITKQLSAGNTMILKGINSEIIPLLPEKWSEQLNSIQGKSISDKNVKWIILLLFFFSALILTCGFYYPRKKEYLQKNSKVLGVSSIIFGILGMTFFFLPPIGLASAVSAILMALAQNRNNPNTTGKIGYVLGIIGCVINVMTLILLLIGYLAG